MTSKRFKQVTYDCIVDNETGKCVNDVESLLNKQHEEIIELREAMKRLMIDLMSGGLR